MVHSVISLRWDGLTEYNPRNFTRMTVCDSGLAQSGTKSGRRVLRAMLLLGSLLLAFQVLRTADLKQFSLSDFGEYWAAGRLLAARRNPYSPAALRSLQSAVGFAQQDAIMMWNPPWALSLVLPFALLPYRIAALLWLATNAGLILVSATLLWRVFSISGGGYLPLVLAVSFVPGLINLRAGHVTPFMLLGIAGFLAFHQARRPFLAGASAALWLLKPHLLWLILLLLAWDIVRNRRFHLLLGLFAGTAALLAIPVIFQPAVLREYLTAMRNFPMLASYAPNFGGLLRMAFGDQYHWLQFAPCVPGLAFLGYALVRHQEDNWVHYFALLALISFITSPYGWSYDEIVLLPAVLHIAARLRKRSSRLRWTALGTYLAANGAVLLVSWWRPHDAYLLWTAPMWLLLYCLALSLTEAKPGSVAAADNASFA
jgi:hypothetical protein